MGLRMTTLHEEPLGGHRSLAEEGEEESGSDSEGVTDYEPERHQRYKYPARSRLTSSKTMDSFMDAGNHNNHHPYYHHYHHHLHHPHQQQQQQSQPQQNYFHHNQQQHQQVQTHQNFAGTMLGAGSGNGAHAANAFQQNQQNPLPLMPGGVSAKQVGGAAAAVSSLTTSSMSSSTSSGYGSQVST